MGVLFQATDRTDRKQSKQRSCGARLKIFIGLIKGKNIYQDGCDTLDPAQSWL